MLLDDMKIFQDFMEDNELSLIFFKDNTQISKRIKVNYNEKSKRFETILDFDTDIYESKRDRDYINKAICYIKNGKSYRRFCMFNIRPEYIRNSKVVFISL